MLKRRLTHGLVPTILLGLSVTATAQAQCNENGGSSGSRPPIVSYDSSYYGFTAGVYGAVNLPFLNSEVTALSIEPALPEGMLFNTATGGITGTPVSPTEGLTPFVVRAFNERGKCGSFVVRLAVNPARASPSPSPSETATPTATPIPSPSASPSPSIAPSPSATPSISALRSNSHRNGRWISVLQAR